MRSPSAPQSWGKILSTSPYLIGAGNAQLVEDRQEDLSTAEHHQGVGDGKDAEDGPIAIDLSRGTQHRDGRHEAGCEGQCNREGTHAAARRQEVL